MRPLKFNLVLATDSYKLTHNKLLPPGTEIVYSYLESRGGMFPATVMAGLQYYLKAYLEGQVFTMADVEEARGFAKQHFGNDYSFNYEGWKRLFDKHKGMLPLRINAVPEGSVVHTHNVLVTVENTDPEFFWLTNYMETLLLKIWYPITVCTLSHAIKKVIGDALVRTGDPKNLPFKLHDFGYRGVSSEETAAIGGAAHLFNFMGTDTIAAIRLLQQYYGATEMPAFSIPASEHSTITAWGKEHEVDAYANMLKQYPEGMVACVSDSYDIYNAAEHLWGEKLRDKVVQRNGTLVIRPDSGDPVVVLEKLFNILEEKFGAEVNSKGWKVLNPSVRVIQGDGVNLFTIENMVFQLTRKGWSMDNWGFGCGSSLLQQVNRDSLKFAFKCSAIRINGKWQDVYKTPVGDVTKNSKRGRLSLQRDSDGRYLTLEQQNGNEAFEELVTVFENGVIKKEYTLAQIRARLTEYDSAYMDQDMAEVI